MGKKNGKGKKRHAKSLVPDARVAAGKKWDYVELGIIPPPEIKRSQDVVRWFKKDCQEWSRAIESLAFNALQTKDSGAALAVIAGLAYDLAYITSALATCLRKGVMPELSFEIGRDPAEVIHAARQLVAADPNSPEEEACERLLRAVEPIAGELHQRSQEERRARIEESRSRPSPWELEEAEEKEETIRARFVSRKLEQLHAKRRAVMGELEAIVGGLKPIATADIDKEIEALDQERSDRIDRAFAPLEAAVRAHECEEREREIDAEVNRRLEAEGLEPLSEQADAR